MSDDEVQMVNLDSAAHPIFKLKLIFFIFRKVNVVDAKTPK